MRIVDVGCGTGDFTRRLAGLVPGSCEVIGVDNRGASLRSAAAEDRKMGLTEKISYRKGDAFAIPVDEDYADLTICRTLLIHLPDPGKAVKEMARVTRPGGLVAAVEPGRMHAFYDPDDEASIELAEKTGEAYLKGIKKLEGKELRIGERLPTIFHKAGLSDIRAEIQADAWMSCDPRFKLEDVKADLQFEYSVFKETRKLDRKYMIAGGATAGMVSKVQQKYERIVRKLLSNDDYLRNSTRFFGSTLFLVNGKKSPA